MATNNPYSCCRKQKETNGGDALANPSEFSSGSNSSTKSEPIEVDGGGDNIYYWAESGVTRISQERRCHSHSASDLDDVECAMTARLHHLRHTWDAALRETVLDEDARAAIMSFHYQRDLTHVMSANFQMF